VNARGFTYLEVLLAVVVLAMGTVAASQALLSLQDQDERMQPQRLARQLLEDGVAWVRTLPRLDPQNPVFGVEADDAMIDDVDDLSSTIETGPTDLGGNGWAADWYRSWSVRSVAPDAIAAPASPGSTTLLEVTITVGCDGADLAATTLLLARTP
jgi:prepilin-type N-terminal cleavage/methylation domain-containing protein